MAGPIMANCYCLPVVICSNYARQMKDMINQIQVPVIKDNFGRSESHLVCSLNGIIIFTKLKMIIDSANKLLTSFSINWDVSVVDCIDRDKRGHQLPFIYAMRNKLRGFLMKFTRQSNAIKTFRDSDRIHNCDMSFIVHCRSSTQFFFN